MASRPRPLSGLALNRIIAVPPGSDQAGSAVRCLVELHRQGATASIVVRGTLRHRYVRSRLPLEARRRGVIPYLPYLQQLWRSVLRTPYAWIDEHALDLWEFRRQLIQSDACDFAQRDHALILHGQQLPVEFYSLLRLLNVPTTVYADSEAMVGDDGATLDEMSRALGVPAVTVLHEKARTTTPIYDFFQHLRPTGARFSSHRPDRPGPRPLLWHHETLDGEAQFVERYVIENPKSRIGLLVPMADMVTAFRKALIPGLGDKVQWYLADAEISPESRVDPSAPGLKILTWSSALGLEFDTAVLAGLHYASNSQSALNLATSLQMLSALARTELILSYSGAGEPPALNLLPRQLLDVRAARLPTASFPPPARPQSSIVAASASTRMEASTPIPPESLSSARPQCRSAVDTARALLAEPGDRTSRRRVLTAEEEVGLAQLMRGPGGDLSAELPKGFRATLSANDERAAAFDAMVTHNDGLVRSLVRAHAGGGLDDEDVYQHGFLGLMRAIEKFDADRGNKFSTYATSWIRQSMSRGVANEGSTIRLPMHVQEQIHRVMAVRSSMLISRQGQAPISAISRATGLTADKVAEYLRLGAGVISLDAPLRGGDPGSSIADLVPVAVDGLAGFDEVIDRQGRIDEVRQALAHMDDREARVLRLRFGFDGQEDRTLDQIGKLFGVTRERVRQIETKAKTHLIVELAAVSAAGRASPVAEPITATAARRAAQPARRPAPQPVARPATPPAPRLAAPLVSANKSSSEEDFRVKRVGSVLASGTRWDLPGYSNAPVPCLRAWLRDLIDQGLASQATRIGIQSNRSGPWSWLALAHDGETSAEAVLRGRLLGGLEDDGITAGFWPTFTAALSLFDEVIVWRTGTFGDAQRSLILASSRDTRAWSLHEGAGSPPTTVQNMAGDAPSSIIVFQAPRLDCSMADLEAAWTELRPELGLSLSELLANRVTLTIGGQQVTPRDPFLWRNPAAQDLGTERITADGHSALVNPRVLPHPSRLLDGNRYSAGDPAEWKGLQGFYVRCEQRYLSCAGWLGLSGLDMSAGTALARVAVEIDPAERGAWGLSEPGRAATPPEPLRPRLAALARLARKRSEQVLAL